MPWSVIENVPAIMNEVHRLQPERTIELGVGFGKFGVLCRETLDGIYGRCAKARWLRWIHGVEIFEPYRNPCWGAYNHVEIANFSEKLVKGWELVLMIDSLEHLDKESGTAFLDGLVANNKNVIVSVPNGPCPQNEAVHGNENEKHLATWYPADFDRYGAKVLHLGYCAVVSIPGRLA